MRALLPVALGTAVLSAAALSACGPAIDDGPPGASSGFAEDLTGIAGEFGRSGELTKEDGTFPDPCDMLAPLTKFGDQALRSGFVIGVEGDGVLGIVGVFGGMDVVFDLYHRQITVSKYAGKGIATPQIASTLAEAYAGFAVGFQHGVADWDGHFVTFQGEIGLPFLREFISLKPSLFVTAVDRDGDGHTSFDDALLPPAGVYGFTVGIALGYSPFPTGAPVEASLTVGLWQPYNSAIRMVYDRLASTHFFRIGRALEVSLVDHHTGQPCDSGWPHAAGSDHQACVIQVGRPEWSNRRSALHMAYAICSVAGSCAVPLSWPVSGLALATGLLQDGSDEINDRCGFAFGGHAPAGH